jgi:CCR4-NOT complex subunit CAF16
MSPDRIGSKLLVLALHWLKEDRRVRLNLEAQGDPAFKKRGARSESSVPSDSEVFYRKCAFSFQKKEKNLTLFNFFFFFFLKLWD